MADAYALMRARLLETGLYRLDGSTLADCELRAYAAGLDPAYEAFGELQRESFVGTAKGYGLENREKTLGLSPAGETEARRKAVMTMGSVLQGGFTKKGIESALAGLGLNVSVEERAGERKLTVRFLSMPEFGKTEALKKLEIFMPAHLPYEPDFSGVS